MCTCINCNGDISLNAWLNIANQNGHLSVDHSECFLSAQLIAHLKETGSASEMSYVDQKLKLLLESELSPVDLINIIYIRVGTVCCRS